SFERVFRIGDAIGYFRVEASPRVPSLNLRIITENPKILFAVVSRVRKMFDLDSDPMLISSCFASVPLLAKLYSRFPGLRLPGAWDGFEPAISTILGQFVSAAQRTRLVNQLVDNYGEEIAHPVSGTRIRLFPSPNVLARSDLTAVKTTMARKE